MPVLSVTILLDYLGDYIEAENQKAKNGEISESEALASIYAEFKARNQIDQSAPAVPFL